MSLTKTIAMAIALLFLIGCSGASDKYTPSITSKDIYTGKDGLSMEFLDNAPPKEIFENGELTIGIKLYNKGAYPIEKGVLFLQIDPEYIPINRESLKFISGVTTGFSGDNLITFNLNGKDMWRPKGGEEVITFTAKLNELSKDPQSKSHTSPIIITSCYPYQTKLVQTVCIDSDTYGVKQIEKSCKVKDLNPGSQGAPIAVTKIESKMIPSNDNPPLTKPIFTITVKNLGNGEATNKENFQSICSSKQGDNEWNNLNATVYISKIDESNQLDCDTKPDKKDGTIKLKQKEGSITCIYEPGFDEKKGTFSTILYVILDYGYTNTISREITIKKLPS